MTERHYYKAMRILKQSPEQVQASMDRCKGRMANDQEVVQYLDAIAQRATLYAEYIGNRTGAGTCGDRKTHDDAAKRAQHVTKRVRKALGYSYPGGGLAGFSW